MAFQHLYSRVPARISMFNRTDGFDTFACSEGLDREYIEKELSPIYDNMPTKNEAALIREGKLPPVFCQKSDKDGGLIQSCISYIAKDYTGERSAYLVHSLVLSDDEKLSVTASLENAALNTDMFISDISRTGIDGENSFPDSAYPEIAYDTKTAGDVSELVRKYEPKTLKFMIYAVINMLYGKGKAVFPVLAVPRDELSYEAVSFMNLFMQIMPYHVRPMLSFVSDAGDTSKFGAFKIRFLPETAEVTAQKGMGILFSKKSAVGIREEEVSANMQIVDFFYGLITNEAVRREFLLYVDNVVKNNPSLAVINQKNLPSLVFLFKQCSGMFNEATVIPNDDKMYEFISVYERYRAAISDEYRMNALKCLQRYPANHAEIPKKVFSKITRFYPTEPDPVKRMIMNIVLDLIHTDIMREKLFSFIKSVYAEENDECRILINKHLASVYYGGFLQSQIFAFFAENFDSEPDCTKELVVDKFLLTIRTPSIQLSILQFFDDRFDSIGDANREKFYETFYKMILEADSLAERLIDFVDRHAESESDETKNLIKDGIFKAAESDQRRREPKLIGILINKEGFCSACLTDKIFTEWSERKIFSEYVEKLCGGSVIDTANGIIKLLGIVPDMSEEVTKRFEDELNVHFLAELPKNNIVDLISAEKVFEENSAALGESTREPINYILNSIRENIANSVYDIFGLKYRSHGMEILADYAKDHQYIVKTDEFKTVVNYLNIVDAILNYDTTNLISHSKTIPDNLKLRTNISQCLKKELPETADKDKNHAVTIAAAYIIIDYFAKGKYSVSSAYASLAPMFEISSKNAAQAEFENDKNAFLATISAIDMICASIDDYSEEFLAGTGISDMVSSFLTKHEKRAPKWLSSSFSSLKISNEIKNLCLETIKELPNGIKKNFKKFLKK